MRQWDKRSSGEAASQCCLCADRPLQQLIPSFPVVVTPKGHCLSKAKLNLRAHLRTWLSPALTKSVSPPSSSRLNDSACRHPWPMIYSQPCSILENVLSEVISKVTYQFLVGEAPFSDRGWRMEWLASPSGLDSCTPGRCFVALVAP